MIIPVKCFTCGMVIADKYRYYLAEVRKKKLAKNGNGESVDINKVVYFTKEFRDKTPEGLYRSFCMYKGPTRPVCGDKYIERRTNNSAYSH